MPCLDYGLDPLRELLPASQLTSQPRSVTRLYGDSLLGLMLPPGSCPLSSLRGTSVPQGCQLWLCCRLLCSSSLGLFTLSSELVFTGAHSEFWSWDELHMTFWPCHSLAGLSPPSAAHSSCVPAGCSYPALLGCIFGPTPPVSHDEPLLPSSLLPVALSGHFPTLLSLMHAASFPFPIILLLGSTLILL